MAVVTSAGARIMTGLTSSPAVLADAGEGGGRMKKWVETFETSAADSTTSTYLVARLPSSARIYGSSKISHDALGATTGTFDIGVFNVAGTAITNDDDALNTGIVVSTAGTKDFLSDRAVWGKRLWEYVNGQSTDPGTQLDIKLTLKTAHLSSGAGTVTVEIDYSSD